MGCDSRESNFQKRVYDGKQWWAQSGYEPSYESPELGPLLDYLGEYVRNYEIIHNKDINRWVAKPR